VKSKRLSLKKKNNIRLLSYILLFTFISIVSVNAATINYYFANSGGGSICSQVSPCANLSDAQTKIDSHSLSDTVNLFFNRGDTWTISTGKSHIINVGSSDPVVNINAYGSGDKPIFDGNVNDFSQVSKVGTGGYSFYYSVFYIAKENSSVKNIEIKRIYGTAIRATNYFTLANTYIHDIGYLAIGPAADRSFTDSTIEYNLIHTAIQLYRFEKCPSWPGAIHLYADPGIGYNFQDNLVRYNVVYDVYGEGINAPGSTIEYNIVGDTSSIGIYPAPAGYDLANTVIRYNFIISSSSNVYKWMSGSSHSGIVFWDEHTSVGDNSNATVEIYGNTVINRYIGIKYSLGTGLGELRVYNNTVIDSVNMNFAVNNPDQVSAAYYYNNVSILYDRSGDKHVTDYGTNPGAGINWYIDNNAFWTTGGSPMVDFSWQTNFVTTNPRLYGEEIAGVDWDGQAGTTYYKDITLTDVTPISGPGLIDTGKTIPFEETYLSNGSDFSVLPTTVNFFTQRQSHDGKWDIGAVIFSDSEEGIIKPPVGLQINIAEPE
jgi:hypothetical protein